MLFPTLDFLLFFVAVLALLVPCQRQHELRKLVLTGASYFFYAQWNWHYCLLLAGSSLLTYAGGLAIDAASLQRTRKVIVGVTACLKVAELTSRKNNFLCIFCGRRQTPVQIGFRIRRLPAWTAGPRIPQGLTSLLLAQVAS